jgi:predicted GIY-YIG superfamily endonuclease
MRTYYIYIMASRSRVLYTGVTNDLTRRVNEHKRGLNAGFTSKYRVTRLVYFEEFNGSLFSKARVACHPERSEGSAFRSRARKGDTGKAEETVSR